MLVSKKEYGSLGDMFFKLKLTESWRGKIPTQEGFTKEDKEGLNLIVFVIFSSIMLDKSIDITALPAYVTHRLYKKAYSWDAKPSNMQKIRQKVPDFDQELGNYITGIMKKQTSDEFAEFIEKESSKFPYEAVRVFRAAKSFAALIEYEEVKDVLREDTKRETRQQVREAMLEFYDLPHFKEIVEEIGEYENLKNLIKSVSSSRYIFRWQGYPCLIRCSILAHMLEAAVISYFMNLEMRNENREEVLKDFFVLMFHDLSEVWTDDIPSPLKDGIILHNPTQRLTRRFGDIVTLRDISEELELKALEEHFYRYLPERVTEFFRRGVMLEDCKDPQKKHFFKAADYFSADYEVWWNLKAGVREDRFLEIIRDDAAETSNRTGNQREFLKELVEKTKNVKMF